MEGFLLLTSSLLIDQQLTKGRFRKFNREVDGPKKGAWFDRPMGASQVDSVGCRHSYKVIWNLASQSVTSLLRVDFVRCALYS